jgi:X-X-X-Leu-X-X-Gly heptad repeat protein
LTNGLPCLQAGADQCRKGKPYFPAAPCAAAGVALAAGAVVAAGAVKLAAGAVKLAAAGAVAAGVVKLAAGAVAAGAVKLAAGAVKLAAGADVCDADTLTDKADKAAAATKNFFIEGLLKKIKNRLTPVI